MRCYRNCAVHQQSVYDVFTRRFIVIQHYIFFTFLTSKFLSFLDNLRSMENDLTAAAEVGWAFCNSA